MRCERIWTRAALAAILPLALAGCPSAGTSAAVDEHEGHDHAGHEEEGGKPCCPIDGQGKQEGHDEHEGHGEQEGQDEHEGHGEQEGQDEHAGHDHGSHGNDLVTPIAELLTMECEHDMRAVDCDQCRYEVGAVKVDQQLVDLALIQLGEATERELDLPVTVNATVGFDELHTVHVSPRVPGIVRSLRVDFGDQVTAGTVLFTVDSQELGEAAGSYLEAMAAERLATLTAARQEELRASGVTSEREYLEAIQQQEAAAIQLRTARGRLTRMGVSSTDLQRLADGDTTVATGELAVRAPQAGTVLDLHATPGELLEPGNEVALIGDLTTVWVWADIYEEDLTTVAGALAGGPVAASFSTPGVLDRVFSGTLDVLGAELDPSTRTTRARVTVDNPDRLLRPGMFGSVELRVRAIGTSLSVPSAAICRDGDQAFVFVHSDGDLYFRRPVHTGREADDRIEIRGGVEPGQKVVADGSFLLKSDVLREKMGAGCAH
jgi:membrane fusion protein, heavy metal efflux system